VPGVRDVGATEPGVYVDELGGRHRVEVRQLARQSWEIVDTPDAGEPVVIEQLDGDLESVETAEAVARDYLTQVQRRAA